MEAFPTPEQVKASQKKDKHIAELEERLTAKGWTKVIDQRKRIAELEKQLAETAEQRDATDRTLVRFTALCDERHGKVIDELRNVIDEKQKRLDERTREKQAAHDSNKRMILRLSTEQRRLGEAVELVRRFMNKQWAVVQDDATTFLSAQGEERFLHQQEDDDAD